MSCIALSLLLTCFAQEPPAEGPRYRYVELPAGVYAKPGQTLYICKPGANVCTDAFALAEYDKALGAGDKAGYEELDRAGRRFNVSGEAVAVKVIEYNEPNQFLVNRPTYEIRVLEGRHVGKKGHVFASSLKHRVEIKEKGKVAPKPKVPGDPAAKADALLRQADALAKAKNKPGALIYYRRVVAEHPGTPQSQIATERILDLQSP